MDLVHKIGCNINLQNYLLKATKNTSINMLKKKKREYVSLNSVSEHPMDNIESLSEDAFLENICEKLEYEKVVEAIQSLDRKYRDVLYYHFIMELTVPETAKVLHQTIATTKKQLVRGKKLLFQKGIIQGGEKARTRIASSIEDKNE